MSDPCFRWLHLSDLHFGSERNTAILANVRQAFFEDLKQRHAKHGPWDAILFSGDLVQSGTAEQFNRLDSEFLDPLREELRKMGTTNPWLLAVPGNHDLARPDAGNASSALDGLLEQPIGKRLLEKLWDKKGQEYQTEIAKCLQNYSDWWKRASAKWNANPARAGFSMKAGLFPGDFAATLQLPMGVQVGIAGVNTTFLQLAGGNYEGRLAMNPMQIQDACDGSLPGWIHDHDASLLMTHHPKEWLSEAFRKSGFDEVYQAGTFAVHLFGHMHQGFMRSESVGGAPQRNHWQAPSLWSQEGYGDPVKTDRRHGYCEGRIEFVGDQCQIRLWPRKASQSGARWRFHQDSESAELQDDGGTTGWTVRRRGKGQGDRMPEGRMGWSKGGVGKGRSANTTNVPTKDAGFDEVVERVMLYLRRIEREARRLPLQRVVEDRVGAQEKEQQMGLDHVYVGVATDRTRKLTAAEVEALKKEAKTKSSVTRAAGESVAVTALEFVRDNRCCVILGDAGSGKSSLLNYLTWNLARLRMPEDQALAKGPDGWSRDQCSLVPVVWVLRRFVEWAGATLLEPGRGGGGKNQGPRLPKPSAHYLWEFLEKKELQPDEIPGVAWMRHAAEKGWVLCLLDGIDEMANPDMAKFVRGCAEDLCTKAPMARVVATSRKVTYARKGNRWAGFESATLQEFDDEKIREFVTTWFKVQKERCGMTLEEADLKASKLLSSIADPGRAELRRLAGNPLLLTVMSFLQAGVNELPENRALLYKDVIELLLHRWDARRSDDGEAVPGLAVTLREVGMDRNGFESVLWRIAWRAQCDALRHRKANGCGDVSHDDIRRELLREVSGNEPPDGWVDRVVRVMRERTGLLVSQSEDVFQFPHRSFQEFLAACYLLDKSKPGEVPGKDERRSDDRRRDLEAVAADYPERIGQLFDEGMYWREVLRWTVGIAAHARNDLATAIYVVGAMCPPGVENESHGWHRVWVAGEALHEIGINALKRRPALTSPVLDRVRPLLVRLVEDGSQLNEMRRHLAGVALGHLDDPRPGVAPACPPSKARPLFCWSDWIGPAETFVMGGDEHAWNGFSLVEPFPLAVERALSDGYHVSRYPVTNAQFDLFEGSPFFAEQARLHGWKKREKSDPRFSGPNQPVVNVTWHDAMRFCNWVNGLGLKAVELGVPPPEKGTRWEVRLPTEAEWEYAARGPEGRWLPWLERPRAGAGHEAPPADEGLLQGRCNWRKAGIGSTSAVGLYPLGRSWCGADDIIGNVWEWTRSAWADTPMDDAGEPVPDPDSETSRVLRGGSWGFVVPEVLRCAARLDGDPWNSYDYVGFRVVCVRVSASGG